MAHSHLLLGAGAAPARIEVRRIGIADLKDALRKGLDDFLVMPTHAMFLCIVYPILGLLLARLALGYSVLPLLYPIATGFALVGPFAALGLYELSRRREAGLPMSVTNAFDVLESSSIGAIAALSLLLLAVFGTWVMVANEIYIANFGYAPSESIESFIRDVFTTRAGWNLIIFGNLVGFCFAVVVLTIGVVSFPLLLDRDVGAAVALLTSIRAVVQNPLIMALWGFIVAALLLIGTLPFFLGLTVVMPVLGHATWHLYRKVVVSEEGPRPKHWTRPPGKRYAADFPANLFPWAREK
jgi:Predicted integral membrane protein